MVTSYTLCKKERLCGKQAISKLFEKGSSFLQYPYKVFWLKVNAVDTYPTRFAVSVPKRRFKKAVKRNLIKRRTREIFRTNKQILNGVVGDAAQIHLMVVYVSDHILPVTELEPAMKNILQRIACQYAESD